MYVLAETCIKGGADRQTDSMTVLGRDKWELDSDCQYQKTKKRKWGGGGLRSHNFWTACVAVGKMP